MRKRPEMEPGDWLSASFNGLIGVFVGFVVYGLLQMVVGGSWLMAAIITVLFAGAFVVMEFIDKLFDLVFPSPIIRRAKKTAPRRPKPLLLALSLPAGLVLGLILALLGLDRAIMDLLP